VALALSVGAFASLDAQLIFAEMASLTAIPGFLRLFFASLPHISHDSLLNIPLNPYNMFYFYDMNLQPSCLAPDFLQHV
jgi:hypothetical protein